MLLTQDTGPVALTPQLSTLLAVVHHIHMYYIHYQYQKRQFSIDTLFLPQIIPINQLIVLQISFMENIHGPFIEKIGISQKKCFIKIQINIHIWSLDFKQAFQPTFNMAIWNRYKHFSFMRPLQTNLSCYRDTWLQMVVCFFYWGICETPNFG